MAGTNLQQWNPTAVNQETDAQYTADSTRAGGAVDPTVFLSILGNKAFYQWSTYLTALFSAFAAKGFTTSDSNLSTLTAQCANFLTTADTLPQIQAVAYSATPTFNAAASNGFQMTLNGNITSMTIAGVAPGQLVAFYMFQDSAGGRTIAWPSNVSGPVVQPDPTPFVDTLYLFRAELSGNLTPAAPAISRYATLVNDLIVNGTLAVTGTLTAASGATITGTISTNQVNVTGGISATGSITTTGAQVNGNETITGATTTGSLHVTGGVTLASGATVTGTISTNGVNVTGNISATGSTTSGSLHVTGSVALDDGATISGTILTNNIDVTTGNATVAGNVNAGTLQVASAAPSGEVLTGNGTSYVPMAIPAQTAVRNDVTGSRSFGTTYTNSSGGVMYVTGYGTTGSGGSTGSVACFVNSDENFAATVTATITGGACGFSFIVPAGSTYSIQANTHTQGGDTAVNGIGKWIETVVS